MANKYTISRIILLMAVVLLSIVFFLVRKNIKYSGRSRTVEKKLSESKPKIKPYEVLRVAYPDFISGFSSNYIIWKDGTRMLYDDGILNKPFSKLLACADLEDQINSMRYPVDSVFKIPTKNHDPGRIRYEPFFRKMYGADKKEVMKNLVQIRWLPKHINQLIEVTKINGIDKKLMAISAEFDNYPELLKYILNPGGTFNWRDISGTKRISSHSFGIAIDINANYSNYWQWDNKEWKHRGENIEIAYQNRIPWIIVRIFRKYGFIWGGNWYHYDTMHFEYRPELLL